MCGLAVGSELRSRSSPRERGSTSTGPIVSACSSCSSKPFCEKNAGARWNWRSGGPPEPSERVQMNASQTVEASGPVRRSIHSSALIGFSPSSSECPIDDSQIQTE